MTAAYALGVTGTHPHHDSALANADHLARLVQKRDALADAARESLDALIVSVARAEWTNAQALELFRLARGCQIPHAPARMAEALGIQQFYLYDWCRQGGPPDTGVGNRYVGTFPVESQITPKNGTPCVYMLMDDAGRCLYVGSSQSVRQRLKVHWRDPLKNGIARWEIVWCESLPAARAIEADLIFQHQPIFNKTGRGRRLFTP